MLFWIVTGFVLAIAAPRLNRFAGHRLGAVLALYPLATAAWLASRAKDAPILERHGWWAPELGMTLSFRLDGLSLTFGLMIAIIGGITLHYAGGYLRGHRHLGRFYSFVLFFLASMLGMVWSENLILLFVFWELTSVASYLLIGFDHEREGARKAALQALLVTGLGGAALLAGFLLIASIAGSGDIEALIQNPSAVRESGVFGLILLLVMLGAFTKSAQFPFHFWLPGAMAAPTPVSALLHSATMVKAGVYLLARLTPVLGDSIPWTTALTWTGAATMVIAAIAAYVQQDLKRILAYSTVSVLGALTMLVGIGTPMALKAAAAYMLAHAMYKASLFLAAGAVDHATGTRDVRRLGGLARLMPAVAAAAGLAGLSKAGLLPAFGFVAKEAMLEAGLQAPAMAIVWTGALTVAGGLMAAIAWKVAIAPFWLGRPPERLANSPDPTLWLGPLALGVAGFVLGLIPGAIGHALVGPAASAMADVDVSGKLALWHGLTPALGLSGLALALGGLLIAVESRATALAERASRLNHLTPSAIYERSLQGLFTLARKQTALLQDGSQRHYLMIILLFFGGVGVAALILFRPGDFTLGANPPAFYEIALGATILLAGGAAIAARSTLAALASLGVAGYGIAAFYMLYGAPDLAITQIIVETLTVILFVLAVYKLPRYRRLEPIGRRLRDALLALAVGAFMTALTLKAAGIQLEPPISGYFIENSKTLAHGANIVNVILVDFRALDTFGEITVLAIAAVGVAMLFRTARGRGKKSKRGGAP